MQSYRYFIYQVMLGVFVLTTCGFSRVNDSVSTALTPDNPPTSTSGPPSSQPSRTALATRTPRIDDLTLTLTLDMKSYLNSWVSFTDHVYEISIEYPSIYREKPYQGVCDPFETRAGVHFGENSEIFIRQRLGTSLDEHIESFIPNYRPNEQFKLESQEAMQVNNEPAIAIRYKLGNATEIRELIFVTVSESMAIYTFSFIGGSACDVPEIGLSERTVFEHAIETFYLQK